jgi:sulfotransferase family protein
MLIEDQTADVLHGKQLVFLVGAPRSGTTWLQLLLARSPFVVTAQETHLFSVFLSSIVDEWNRLRKGGQRTGVNLVLIDEEFRRLLRSTSGFVLAKIAQSKPSATVVLDKTPDHVRFWREILDAWPEAHFIHIIRDPRSVVASLRVASRSWAAGWASSRISRNCERWIGDVGSGRQIRSVTPNYQEVCYEELISDGPNVVMRLLTGLGIRASRDECTRYFEECNIENLRAGKLNGAPFDVAKMHKESFRIGAIDSWRVELSPWEIALVDHLAGPLMSELGFAPASKGRATAAAMSVGCTLWDAARAVKRRLRRFANSSQRPQN